MATVGLQTCDVIDCLPRRLFSVAGDREQCVLLIEDHEESMLLVRYALQEYGNGIYRLEWANGLTSGLSRIASGGVDLIILDLGLPETSGAASYAAVKQAAPDLPILVLTADTSEDTELKITSEGVEDFLVKEQVSGALLLQAIRTALYSNSRWREQHVSSYKTNPQFVWAAQGAQALQNLAIRMLRANRIESAISAVKALCAIVENYSSFPKSTLAGRADLFLFLERIARAAADLGHRESARRFRALMIPPLKSVPKETLEFEELMKHKISGLGGDLALPDLEPGEAKAFDLAKVLREILASSPKLT